MDGAIPKMKNCVLRFVHALAFSYLCNISVKKLKRIPIYRFYRHKYGSELLIDVLDLDYLKDGIRRAPVHCETFYQIVLFTSSGEQVGVNGCRRTVHAGDVVCGRPGEVWEWQQQTKLQGDVLIFEKPFLISFFNDAHFLERFYYLQADRPSPFLFPDAALQQRLRLLFRQMKEEIDNPDHKDQHILRAMLYEFLMLLERAAGDNSVQKQSPDVAKCRYVEQFEQLADERYAQHHDVEYYAAELCITSNYLNRLVSRYLGMTTKQYLNNRLADESKRLLTYTSMSINEIAEALNFESPAYFVRFFRKAAGTTPTIYRSTQAAKE